MLLCGLSYCPLKPEQWGTEYGNEGCGAILTSSPHCPLHLDRIPQPVSGCVRLPKDFAMACVLCQKDRKLKESHILSRFIYKPLKKLEGKMYVLTEAPSQKSRPIQDGVKDYLLCGECEAKRSKGETYFSHKWHGGELFGQNNPYTIERLDSSKFKLFLMSTLFKESPRS